MKDRILMNINPLFCFLITLLILFLFFSVASEALVKGIFPPEITGECILEIKGTGFGRDKGRVLLDGDKMDVFKWKRKRIKVFVPEAYELPYITVVTRNGKTLAYQTEEREKDCNYDRLKYLTLGSGKISYSQKWRKIKYNEKKGVAMLLRKNRNALISFARTKIIPEIFTLYSMVSYFKKNEITLGKISLSSIKSFINCEGRSGYSFVVKSFLKNKPYFQYYIYFMDDSRRIYQVIFSSIKKKDRTKKNSLEVLKSIRFAG